MIDRLSPELRQLETRVDQAYYSHALLQYPYEVAIWHLLANAEDITFLYPFHTNRYDIRNAINTSDVIKFALRHVLNWAADKCRKEDHVPRAIDERIASLAKEFTDIALSYIPFVTAFTYASRGVLSLKIHGDSLTHNFDMSGHALYEAYDTSSKVNKETKHLQHLTASPITQSAVHDFLTQVKSATIVRLDDFSVRITPRLAKAALRICDASSAHAFDLPADWKLFGVSLQEFRTVFNSMAALATIRLFARTYVLKEKSLTSARNGQLWIVTRDELVNRIAYYTSIQHSTVATVLEVLTLGACEQTFPDPCLQPLVPISKNSYAVIPLLWTSSSAERNLVVLANRVPRERNNCLSLVNRKEEIMRKRVEDCVSRLPVRCWYGNVSGSAALPDIDLAIIDDKAKQCLVAELKWFVAPADSGEVCEKSEEIAKGISQMLRIKAALSDNPMLLQKSLSVTSEYLVSYCVISYNFAGMAYVQDVNIPVVHEHDFLHKCDSGSSLLEVITWLKERGYLPTSGMDFTVHNADQQLAGVTLHWYGIESLKSSNSHIPSQ